MIKSEKVSKFYGKKAVLEDVSLEIPKGKITGFIGPNGAGKSTYLGIIARLLASDGGEIEIAGKNLKNYLSSELAKVLAILRQESLVNIKITVRDLVGFGRFPYSGGKLTENDHEIVACAISQMGLDEFKERFLDELSGGQKQRAFIAMVIAQDTEYVLFDEPLNNLDIKHSISLMKIMQNLRDNLQKTIIVVLHDINFASSFCDHIVAFKDGKVFTHGAPEKVINAQVLEQIYETPFEIHTIKGKNICVYF